MKRIETVLACIAMLILVSGCAMHPREQFERIQLGETSVDCVKGVSLNRAGLFYVTRSGDPMGIQEVTGVIAMKDGDGRFIARCYFEDLSGLALTTVYDLVPEKKLLSEQGGRRSVAGVLRRKTLRYVLEVQVPHESFQEVPVGYRIPWGICRYVMMDYYSLGAEGRPADSHRFAHEAETRLTAGYARDRRTNEDELRRLVAQIREDKSPWIRSEDTFEDVCPKSLDLRGNLLEWILLTRALLDAVPHSFSELTIRDLLPSSPVGDPFFFHLLHETSLFRDISITGYERTVVKPNGMHLSVRYLGERTIRIEITHRVIVTRSTGEDNK